MIEIQGNIWDAKCAFICITTCGDIKKNGDLVMGRGIAHQCANRNPGIAKQFAASVQEFGHVFTVTSHLDQGRQLVIFPTKYTWQQSSSMILIAQSVDQLNLRAVEFPDMIWALPRPGCSNGGLDWWEVKNAISYLPNNVHIYSRIGEV